MTPSNRSVSAVECGVACAWFEEAGAAGNGPTHATIVVSTVRQLRAPSPNPWEAAWTIWHYTDRAHFYYFVLRANGWELGKRDPAAKGGQRFLSSGNQPHATLAQPNAVRIVQRGHRINVFVDGIPVTAYSDTSVP